MEVGADDVGDVAGADAECSKAGRQLPAHQVHGMCHFLEFGAESRIHQHDFVSVMQDKAAIGNHTAR